MSAPPAPDATAPSRVSLRDIFVAFLIIGATSFGGGVVAYLRNSLVLRHGWLDEEEFLSALEISQALPGLNATNMSVIVGDRLRGLPGAVTAFVGMTLPGGALVLTLGIAYAANAHNAMVNATLVGVGAASVGMLSAVTLQIGRKQLGHLVDLAIIAVTVVLVSFLHVPLLIVLLTVGPVAVFLYRPRPAPDAETADAGDGR